METILDLYKKHSCAIFKRRWIRKYWMLTSKYKSDSLSQILKDEFGDMLLQVDLPHFCGVCVMCVFGPHFKRLGGSGFQRRFHRSFLRKYGTEKTAYSSYPSDSEAHHKT